MDSPFGGLKILPGSPYAQNFNVSLTSAISAGHVFGASVLIRDAIYNSISSSVTAPEATLLRRPVYGEDESDIQVFPFALSSTLGVFEGSLLVTRAATYALSVSFNKILAGTGTIAVVVSPGVISVAACTVSGNIGGGHVSSPSNFLIVARDVFGNQISTGQAEKPFQSLFVLLAIQMLFGHLKPQGSQWTTLMVLTLSLTQFLVAEPTL